MKFLAPIKWAETYFQEALGVMRWQLTCPKVILVKSIEVSKELIKTVKILNTRTGDVWEGTYLSVKILG